MLRTLVQEATNAPGTGAASLLGAPVGRVRWSTAFASGARAFYTISDGTLIEWGVGTLTTGASSSLSRDTVLGNSAGTTTRLNFTGAAVVSAGLPAEKAVWVDQNGKVPFSAVQVARRLWCGAAGGTATAITLALPQALSVLGVGLRLRFLAAARCTGPTTVDAIGASPVALRRLDGTQLGAGDILAGQVVEIAFNGTDWRLVTPPASQVRLVGEMVNHSGGVLPDGYIWPAGQNVSRSQYQALHALYQAAGYPYGAGDGSTTFGVPDARGRISVPRDDLGGTAAGRVTAAVSGIAATTLGASGGDERAQQHNHTAVDAGHSHGGSTASAGSHTHDMYGNGGPFSRTTPVWGAGIGSTAMPTEYAGAHTHSVTAYSAAAAVAIADALAGTGQNLPPVLVVNKMLYAGA